jgi:Protein of unknown function (DUF3011)
LVAWAAVGTAAQAQTIRCASDDGGKKYCSADTSHGVRLVKRLSADVPCPKDSAWGYDEKGIWVDHGCDAEFALGPETAAAGASSAAAKTLTCTSDGGKKYCDAHTGRGVRLVKQRSEAPCKKDVTWGYDGLGIWVDGGCSADFQLGDAAASSGNNAGADSGKAQDVSCLKKMGKAHADTLVKQCLQVSPATHPPCNSANSCELIEDEIRRSCGLLGMDAPAFCGGYK